MHLGSFLEKVRIVLTHSAGKDSMLFLTEFCKVGRISGERRIVLHESFLHLLTIWSKLLAIEDYVERIIIGFAVKKSGSVTAIMADTEDLISLWDR